MGKLLEIEGTPAEVLGSLVELRKRDLTIERRKRKWGWALGLSLLGAIALFVFLGVLGGPKSAAGKAVLVAALAAAATFIVSVIVYSVYSARDYDNRKLFLAMDMINFLGRDMPAKSRCAMMVSFDSYLKHGRLLGKEGGGVFNPITFKTYEDLWFTIKGRLYDGNSYDLSINQLVKRKERRKRKGTKVKEKICEEVLLALKVDPETYGGIDAIDEKLQQGASAAGLIIRKAVYQDGKLKVGGRGAVVIQGTQYGHDEEGLTTAETVFQFLFYVYQALGECRTAA